MAGNGSWPIGGLVSGVGFLLLGQARDFWQFAIVPLAAYKSGRFAHGLDGGERFHLAMVRAHARPRSRSGPAWGTA